ncbi:Ferrichrome outer membrane transporter/phage receptor [Zhongshania aliphaticivorans]|uniref:Ferrichrome outer membrane transporter/phage receptor n=1 Tax=Zhongshania aliphaticivorans TaxID=1470434 RepID=A0A5S9P3Y1_9GAMM|nr:TonB-dependent siderophore receptor [Zhongshania aliphaticivorans]CAA0090599.1 Ferrichrome outer membrane transporter/phage receptor [Zhongshania aliphaticivorans]CAA0098091.1 Ferrichrome outer membrane transporter/phage receptor [Zhongshania aliphaticivorans]
MTISLKPILITPCLFFSLTVSATEQSQSDSKPRVEELTVFGQEQGNYTSASVSNLSNNGIALSDTPISIQTVPKAVLEDQDANSLQDALRNVSGVQPAFTMGGAYERLTIRGFTNNLASYKNGVIQPVLHFYRANTERVEVLKGPAALELGMSDPGGAINVVTHKPTETPYLSLSQSVGSLDEYSTTVNANTPLGSKDVLFHVDASWRHYGGFRDITDTEEYMIAPSLLFKLSDSTQLRINMELAQGEYIYDQGLHAWEDGIIDLPRERSYGQDDAFQDFDNQALELVIDHVFSEDWSLQAGASFSNSETYFRSIYATGNPSPGNTVVRRSAWFGPESVDSQSFWTQLNGRFNTASIQHNITLGLQAFAYDFDGKASITFIEEIDILTYRSGDSSINVSEYNGYPQVDAITQQDDQTQGVFIQDQMYLSERLIALLGLRYDSASRELDTSYFSPVEHSQRDDDKTTGRAGLIYKFDNGFSPYISYATSFGPGFNYLPSALYDPEEAEQIEAGFKATLFNNKAQLNLSIFELTKTNIPTADPNIPNRTIAIGEAQSRGLELDVIGEFNDNLSVMGNLALTKTEITKDFSGNEGNELPNAPATQASLWLRYTLGSVALGGGPVFVSERFGTADNSYEDDAYTRWDLFAAYDFELGNVPATARLVLNNITDERYYTLRSRWSNMPSEPFNAVASVSLSF